MSSFGKVFSTIDTEWYSLQEIFKLIADKYAPGFDSHKSVVLLDGDEFESKKTNVASRLEKGEKIFVISVYQTIGAGQNLQYKAPESIKENLVRVNDRGGYEKDYDAIYLDKPTNLLVFFNEGQAIGEEDFVKALFQYEMLQEGAELSPEETTKHIKNAFRHYISNGTAKRDFTQQNAHDTKSIRMLSTRYIIQAIGRICRTSLKNQNIYIFADRRIADGLDLSVMRNRILNKEFEALLDCVRRNGYEPPEIRSLENEANLKSSRVNKDIRNMLEENWDDKRIQKWKALRDLVLKHPTMSEAEIQGNFPAWNYYIQLPARDNKCFYHQEEDFNNISIRFSPDATHKHIVSEADARLNTLMSFRSIKDLFEKEGYATTFIANDYLMSPPLWNNIYKGALGEVVGQYLFGRVLQVELDDIADPDLFELFDYKVRNMPVFVDFKNWHESTSFDWEKQINKIGRKAEKCGCKCVIIANIITEKEYRIHKTTKDGVEIFVIPALLYPNPNRVNEKAWKQIKECVERYAD